MYICMNHDAVINNDNILSVGHDLKYDEQVLYAYVRLFFVRNHYGAYHVYYYYIYEVRVYFVFCPSKAISVVIVQIIPCPNVDRRMKTYIIHVTIYYVRAGTHVDIT